MEPPSSGVPVFTAVGMCEHVSSVPMSLCFVSFAAAAGSRPLLILSRPAFLFGFSGTGMPVPMWHCGAGAGNVIVAYASDDWKLFWSIDTRIWQFVYVGL